MAGTPAPLPLDGFAELGGNELAAWVTTVQAVDRALTTCWRRTFPNDPLELVYVVYVFESEVDPTPTKHHMHIHLIPRCLSLRQLLPPDSRKPGVDARKVPRVIKESTIPRQYQTGDHNVTRLMAWLRDHLRCRVAF